MPPPRDPDIDAFLRTAALLPEAMLLVGADGALHAANRAGQRLLGVDAEASDGRPLQQFVWDDEVRLASVLRGFARTRELQPATLTLRGADGDCVPHRCDGALFAPADGPRAARLLLRLVPREEAISRFVALSQRIDVLSQEIARRRRIEGELQEQRERLRVTLASIGEAVIVTDTGGRITFMNPVACELTGCAGEDAIGRLLEEVFVIVNQRTREPVECPVRRVLREGVTVGLANHTVLVSRDGRERPIDDSGAPIRDDQGRMLGVVLVFHDVSERNTLERRLSQQAEELRAADRRKDEFLAMLSHELRNPLAALGNGVHLLAAGVAERRAGEVVAMMRRQLEHLGGLVNDLLDVTRISRGTIALQRALMVLADALRLALETVQPLIEHGRHALVTELPHDDLCIEGDINRIAQVFTNLLSNACKFTPPGGRIELRFERRGELARISVRDSGRGLSPSMLERVFELFEQGDRAFDRRTDGLGVGLTIARALVEMHQGRIIARSDGPGRGSEFVVWLPLATSALAAPRRSLPSPVADRPRRVLLVDDNVDAARALALLLESWGHRVALEHGGEAAVARFAEFAPDVVLLDLGMPGMDGIEVARRLRRLGGEAVPVLVALSGYGREADRAQTRAVGFDHHLIKPPDLDALRRLLSCA